MFIFSEKETKSTHIGSRQPKYNFKKCHIDIQSTTTTSTQSFSPTAEINSKALSQSTLHRSLYLHVNLMTFLPYILTVPWWIPAMFMLAADMSEWRRAQRAAHEDRRGREAHEAQCEFLMRGFNPHSGPMFPASAAGPMRCYYTQLTVYSVQRCLS